MVGSLKNLFISYLVCHTLMFQNIKPILILKVHGNVTVYDIFLYARLTICYFCLLTVCIYHSNIMWLGLHHCKCIQLGHFSIYKNASTDSPSTFLTRRHESMDLVGTGARRINMDQLEQKHTCDITILKAGQELHFTACYYHFFLLLRE